LQKGGEETESAKNRCRLVSRKRKKKVGEGSGHGQLSKGRKQGWGEERGGAWWPRIPGFRQKTVICQGARKKFHDQNAEGGSKNHRSRKKTGEKSNAHQKEKVCRKKTKGGGAFPGCEREKIMAGTKTKRKKFTLEKCK